MSNRFQPFFEFWINPRCPECKTMNWIYQSHSERQYPDVPNGCECYKCGHKFWIGSEDDMKEEYWTEHEEEGVEYVINEIMYYNKGKERPE